MTAPSSRSHFAVAVVAGVAGLTLIMSSVSDFIPDALELPILTLVTVVAIVVIIWIRGHS